MPGRELVAVLPTSRSTPQSRELLVVTTRTLHRWTLAKNGENKLNDEWKLHELVEESFRRDEEKEELHISIMDAGWASDSLWLLVNVWDDEATYPSLVSVHVPKGATDGEEFVIRDKKLIDYRYSDPSLLDVRLHLAEDGITAFLVFPKAILLTSTQPDNAFEDDIPLNFENDQIIGFSACGHATETQTMAVGFSAKAYLLQFEVDPQMGDPQAKQKGQLYSKLEAAVYYGDASNPISFDLTEIAGDINSAAVELSTKIIKWDPARYKDVKTIREQLNDRLQRTNSIMNYVCDFMYSHGSVSENTLEVLIANAERIAVALRFWDIRTGVIGGWESSPSQSDEYPGGRLDIAIKEYFKESQKDPISEFFKTRILDVGKLLEFVYAPFRGSLMPTPENVELLKEANNIIVIFYMVGRQQRETNLSDLHKKYGIQLANYRVEPWSEQCELTQRFLAASETSVDRQLANQLSDLTDVCLGAYHSRITYLKSPSSKASPERELQDGLLKQHETLQWDLLLSLLKWGQDIAAFELAEKYRTFRILASLATAVPDKSERIKGYAQTYGAEFANALFENYLAIDQYEELLNQPLDDRYLDDWFRTKNLPQIKWLHDVHLGHFQDASESLKQSAAVESNITKRRVAFSLSKLAWIASVGGNDTATFEASRDNLLTPERRTLLGFEKATDSLTIFESLQRRYLDQLAAPFGVPQDLEAQASMVTQLFFPDAAQPQKEQINISVRKVLQLKYAEPDELLDLVTLSNEDAEQMVENYRTAVEILTMERENGRDVSAELRMVWRRAWISVNWEAVRGVQSYGDMPFQEAKRTTLVYQMLSALCEKGEEVPVPDGFFAPPSECFETYEGFKSRLLIRNLPEEAQQSLWTTVAKENHELQGVIERQGAEEWYKELLTMAKAHAPRAAEQMDVDR
ncbi:hypothetical protein HDV00_003041 [Rhizophlyctis rosea]|nr:hypothetical protein HDV00_003041 [Rhizophlyctis rosea]